MTRKVVKHLYQLEETLREHEFQVALMDFKKITIQRDNISHDFVIKIEAKQ